MPSPSAATRPLSGSPVPAQTTPFWSTATAPIACTVSFGHTDANVCAGVRGLPDAAGRRGDVDVALVGRIDGELADPAADVARAGELPARGRGAVGAGERLLAHLRGQCVRLGDRVVRDRVLREGPLGVHPLGHADRVRAVASGVGGRGGGGRRSGRAAAGEDTRQRRRARRWRRARRSMRGRDLTGTPLTCARAQRLPSAAGRPTVRRIVLSRRPMAARCRRDISESDSVSAVSRAAGARAASLGTRRTRARGPAASTRPGHRRLARPASPASAPSRTASARASAAAWMIGLVVGPRQQAPAAALDVQRKRAVDQDHERAGLAPRSVATAGRAVDARPVGPAECSAVRVGRVGGRQHDRARDVAGSLAADAGSDPVDRAGQRELRGAKTLRRRSPRRARPASSNADSTR